MSRMTTLCAGLMGFFAAIELSDHRVFWGLADLAALALLILVNA